MREIEIQTPAQHAFGRRHIDQAVVVRFRGRAALALDLGSLRLLCFSGRRWLIESSDGFVARVDPQPLTARFDNDHPRRAIVEFDLHPGRACLLFSDDQLARHVFVAFAADDRTGEAESASAVWRKLHHGGRVRFDLLVDSKLLQLKAVLHVNRRDQQPHRLSFLDRDRLRLKLESPGRDLDLDGRRWSL